MPAPIRVIEADITTLSVDAVVNAANELMLGGGGVDGAIHRAAGPQLYEECRRVPEASPGVRRPTGQARITKAYDLPAKFVIHTVGPVWHGGEAGEAELLAGCYRNSLELAVENGVKSIAFPAISTGVYRFPIDQAARIAAKTAAEFLKGHSELSVTFACFGAQATRIFKSAVDALGGGHA